MADEKKLDEAAQARIDAEEVLRVKNEDRIRVAMIRKIKAELEANLCALREQYAMLESTKEDVQRQRTISETVTVLRRIKYCDDELAKLQKE